MRRADAVAIVGKHVATSRRLAPTMRLGAVLLIVTATVACATHRSVSIADRFVKEGQPAVDLGGRVEPPSTAEYVSQLRALATQARPRTKTTAPEVLESRHGLLRETLATLHATPSAAAARDVAVEYRRLGILDLAFSYASAAIKIDPKDAASYDLRAKIWRGWGLPGLGLPDARRAVALAPKSATAWNTLGLLLEEHGSSELAVRAYVRAVRLDAQAGYAWNNLCRAWTAAGEGGAAVSACHRTLTLEPSFTDAQIMLSEAERLVAARSSLEHRAVETARTARAAR